jgi:TonB-dependent starch-binding outer membrane protein SusC
MNKHLRTKQFMLLMLLSLFCCISVYAQEQTVTVNVKNVSLREVFRIIEKQTTYRFSYRNALIDNRKDITISKEHSSVNFVLNEVLIGRDLEYKIISPKLIVVSNKEQQRHIEKSAAQGQKRKISGIIKDASGEPVIGASVFIKGTDIGTISDVNGEFSLEAPMEGFLRISCVGYDQQQFSINNRQSFDITLEENVKAIDEVVVIGYGVQKKKLNTGATVQLKGDELAKLNTNNALVAMQGQTPGVNIISNNGQPGSSMKVIIRGQGSNTDNTPLYIIDGVPGDITNISPSDIQSVDVLKDAASAAIYGAQAANGVVLVTTKTGHEGKAQVSFDAYYGGESLARKIKMCNAKEYMKLMDEQAVNSGNTAYDWTSYKSIYDSKGNLNDTNWLGLMFKNTKTENYVFGINGGTSTSLYAISLGYYNEGGIVGGPKASNYDRYNLRVNLEQKFYGDFLKVGENVGLAWVRSRGVGTGNMYGNILRPAFAVSPLQAEYIQDGRADLNNGYNYSESGDWNQYDGNPVAAIYRSKNISDNQNWTANIYAEIQPIKNLKIKTLFGLNYNASSYRSYSPDYVSSSRDEQITGSTAYQSMYKGVDYLWTNTANYDWKLGQNAFNVMAGTEIERSSGDNLNAQNTLLDVYDSWSTAYVSNTKNTAAATANGYPNNDYCRISYFGRVGWNYNETYMLNATLRCDGSSRFAQGHRYGWFPSISGGWVITNENFMKSTTSWLDFLKLRASWGQVGNNNIGDYLYATPITLSGAGYNFGGTGSGVIEGSSKGTSANSTGAYPTRLGNNKLKWETSEQTDLGFDARFLKNRLGANFDYYYKKTKDWIIQAAVIATVGTNPPYINGGDVINKGVEINLTWDDKIGRNFKYNVGANLAYNKNDVGKIPTSDGLIHGASQEMFDSQSEFYRCEDGHAMGFFWGYKTAGIFQNQSEIDKWKAAGNGLLFGSNTAPGDAKYADVNHDGTIDDNDKVDLGCGIPKYNFGFNAGFSYKNFDFSTTLTGAAGFKIAAAGYRNWGNQLQANYTTQYLKSWNGDGTSNKLPRLTNDDKNWTNCSDLWLQKGDYLRVANITLGYDFAKLLKYRYISEARIYAQVQNLYTFTGFKGMDPDVGYSAVSWAAGIDTGNYPRARIFLFGVNIKF